jgi:two-component system, OmpR family, response regulator
VFLSSRDEEIDKIVGLELGGDDYVTKPFSPRELSARVKAVLRRTSAQGDRDAEGDGGGSDGERKRRDDRGRPPLLHGPIRLDNDRHEVTCLGAEVRLTVTEFGILASLMAHPGRVFSRSQLMETAYAYDNMITERTIDTHIKRIRRKFREAGHDPIETIYGLGYKLKA